MRSAGNARDERTSAEVAALNGADAGLELSFRNVYEVPSVLYLDAGKRLRLREYICEVPDVDVDPSADSYAEKVVLVASLGGVSVSDRRHGDDRMLSLVELAAEHSFDGRLADESADGESGGDALDDVSDRFDIRASAEVLVGLGHDERRNPRLRRERSALRDVAVGANIGCRDRHEEEPSRGALVERCRWAYAGIRYAGHGRNDLGINKEGVLV